MEDKTKNGITYEHIMLSMMSHFPNASPREIERVLEYMQDMELLNEQGDKLKNKFWERFWEE